MAPDGSFRTALSLAETARILKIEPAAIIRPGSSDEIDPGAVLFRAVSGTLTERAKAEARQERQEQAAQGRVAHASGNEWLIREYAFTLDHLRHPDGNHKPVLEAISRAARELLPEPGEKTRAVPVQRADIEGRDLKPGYLPLDAPPASAPDRRRRGNPQVRASAGPA